MDVRRGFVSGTFFVIAGLVACASSPSKQAVVVLPPPAALPTAAPTASAKPARRCAAPPPANGSIPADAAGKPLRALCHVDTDCHVGREGRCVFSDGHGERVSLLACTHDDCETDADCPGNVCVCGTDVSHRSHCVIGDCRDDDDCDGAHCGVGHQDGVEIRFCHRPGDQCSSRRACHDAQVCEYDRRHGRYECKSTEWLE